MSATIASTDQSEGFDQLALEKAVRALCRVEIRRTPLSLERTKAWVNQFVGDREKCLAWLILRHLVYRTGAQLESSLRQAIKEAATHFLRLSLDSRDGDWRQALAGKLPGLKFYCGPPTLNSITLPGKSGELMTRVVNRNYGVEKYYPHDITTLQPEERYLVVDDGAYTGQQLIEFLQNWRDDYSNGNVAIVVGLAHQQAVSSLQQQFPSVPLFFGELLTERNSLKRLSDQWVADGQWLFSEDTPHDTYMDICRQKGPFEKPVPEGFGSLGLMVAFEHGIPDDSLQLLWSKSTNWIPLIEK